VVDAVECATAIQRGTRERETGFPATRHIEAAAVGRMAFPLPDRPSIVVLPLENLSAEPDQEYFADGITEDVTTELSEELGPVRQNRPMHFWRWRVLRPRRGR
jgi:hypothetical protein